LSGLLDVVGSLEELVYCVVSTEDNPPRDVLHCKVGFGPVRFSRRYQGTSQRIASWAYKIRVGWRLGKDAKDSLGREVWNKAVKWTMYLCHIGPLADKAAAATCQWRHVRQTDIQYYSVPPEGEPNINFNYLFFSGIRKDADCPSICLGLHACPTPSSFFVVSGSIHL
jgi:hypothetical protein